MSVYELGTTSLVVPAAPAWKYVQCVTDSWDRALRTISTSAWDMTVTKCTDFCTSKGLALAGLEAGNECFCASALTISAGAGKQVGDGECGSNCGGDGTQKCGGTWRVSLYSTLTGQALNTALGQVTQTTTSTTTTATVKTTTAALPTTTPPAPTPTQAPSFTISSPIPGGGRSDNKQIYAHFILGNAYPYNRDTWRRDIDRAVSAGLDGFFLNIGMDTWQPARVADAYAVAQEKGFKMVLSFDMAELDCGSWNRYVLIAFRAEIQWTVITAVYPRLYQSPRCGQIRRQIHLDDLCRRILQFRSRINQQRLEHYHGSISQPDIFRSSL